MRIDFRSRPIGSRAHVRVGRTLSVRVLSTVIPITLVTVIVSRSLVTANDSHKGDALLTAAILSALVIFAHARFKDWLYPPVLQAGLWAFLCFWFWLVQDTFRPIGFRTWLVILLGAGFFSAGALLTTLGHTPCKKVNVLTPGSVPSNFGRILVLSVSICFLAPLLMAASSALRNPGAYLSLISDVRSVKVETNLFGRLYIGFWWALTNLGLCVFMVLDHPKRKRGWFFLGLGLLLALAFAVPMGGRSDVLFVLLILSGIPLLLRRIQPWKVALSFAVIVPLIFIGYSYLAGHGNLSLSSASLSDQDVVTDIASTYMVGPIAAFDYGSSTFDSASRGAPEPFGYRTFRIIYLWLSYLGYTSEVAPLVQDFAPISSAGATNIYTVYWGYYLDFGLIGVVIAQFLFGIWQGFLYRRATLTRPRALWVMLYVIFLFPLLMQSALDMYVPTFSNYVNFAFIFVLIFGFFRVARLPRGGWTITPPGTLTYEKAVH